MWCAIFPDRRAYVEPTTQVYTNATHFIYCNFMDFGLNAPARSAEPGDVQRLGHFRVGPDKASQARPPIYTWSISFGRQHQLLAWGRMTPAMARLLRRIIRVGGEIPHTLTR
jgi:hypothetical protein